jgi:hypothetical protein
MICDRYGNVWIIEPGRGNMYSVADEFEFCIMTNTSLLDAKNAGKCVDCSRYETAEKLLIEFDKMNVDKAFSILDAVKQEEGEWITDFSMVFSKKEQNLKESMSSRLITIINPNYSYTILQSMRNIMDKLSFFCEMFS